jgi:SAM-dependent methyltransferase
MSATEQALEEWVGDIPFERVGLMRRLLKTVLINPVGNYLPAGMLKAMLRFGRSELAAANWADPGGWRSMVISYNGRCRQIADKILVRGGSMAIALRNRRRLAGRLIARLIDQAEREPVEVLCLGAGPGLIIMDALAQARRSAHATLVDLSGDAFDYGRELADRAGLSDRVRFIRGDVRDVRNMLDRPPDLVKMLGICEYLDDEHIVHIARAVAEVMLPGSAIVFNSLSRRHGTDRFFRRVFGLHMIHRSVHQLQEMMREAGFEGFVSIPEPLGVYHVIVGRKGPGPRGATSKG